MSSDLVVANELISKPQQLSQGQYRWIKVLPTTGSTAIQIRPAGVTAAVQFEIPTRPVNYSRSFICGRLNFRKPAAGKYLWRYADSVFWCNSVRLTTRSGAVLIDLPYIQRTTQTL